MRVQFVERQNAVEKQLCEAEIVFDDDGPLAGMKLVGITIWKGPETNHVTMPARSFGAGGERRFFDFLRAAQPGGGDLKRVKDWILAEYEAAKSA